MSHLFPQSLAGRLMFWLLASLLLVQAGFALVQEWEHRKQLKQLHAANVQSSVVTVARILEKLEPESRKPALLAAGVNEFSFDLNQERHFTPMQPNTYFWTSEFLNEKGKHAKVIHMQSVGENGQSGTVREVIEHHFETAETHDERQVHPLAMKAKEKHKLIISDKEKSARGVALSGRIKQRKSGQGRKFMTFAQQSGEGVSLQLTDGQWLNATGFGSGFGSGFGLGAGNGTLASAFQMRAWLPLAITAVLMAMVVIVVVHFETRSLKVLAGAANRLGRGEKLAPLEETGPKETRAALHAFNKMGARIGKYVADRTQMLAAMSHDIRTPLTTMRLRIEEIEDEALREKLVHTIEEMKTMTDATLAFAQADANIEPLQETDLYELAGSLLEEFLERGHKIEFANAESLRANIRPNDIKRAMRNLLENAIRYGKHAQLSIQLNAENVCIMVSDRGPGIPVQDMDSVFEPFTRLETSRNQATGGVGLGLAIARTIVQSHGGEVSLKNRKNGGLIATINLPLDR